MKDFTVVQLIVMGMPVSGVLLALSALSLMVVLERVVALRREMGRGALLIRLAGKLQGRESVARLLGVAQENQSPAARVLTALFRLSRDEAQMMLPQEMNRERTRLERGIQGLATIASVAPYVGLFGTCVGVIKAFALISSNTGGGPGVVAGGIAEALVNTALGLFVAIPAVVAYNLLATSINRHLREVAWAAQSALAHAGDEIAAPATPQAPVLPFSQTQFAATSPAQTTVKEALRAVPPQRETSPVAGPDAATDPVMRVVPLRESRLEPAAWMGEDPPAVSGGRLDYLDNEGWSPAKGAEA